LLPFAVVVACGGEPEGSSGPDPSSGGGGSGGQEDVPVCGNGEIEAAEACDDAGRSASCNEDCTVSVCGDGVVNPLAGEQCDGGDAAACDTSCRALPIDLDDASSGFWPALTVSGTPGNERFEVAYTHGHDVLLRSVDVDGTVGEEGVIAANESPGPISLAASPLGGALVAWQGTDVQYGNIRWLRVDDALTPIGDVGQWSITSGGRDPKVAAASGGGYCVAGFLKSLPPQVNCIDATGHEVGGATFTETFGGIYYEGTHDLVAVGDGYVFSYVPDDTNNDVVGYALSSTGSQQGSGFVAFDLADPSFSWLPSWSRGAADTGFVALAGAGPDFAGERQLYHRPYSAPGVAIADAALVSDDSDVQHGFALRHSSGRYLVAWVGDVVSDPDGAATTCSLRSRLFEADGTPLGDAQTLHQPASGCLTGPRGAVTADGDVLLSWLLASQEGNVKQAMLLPRLLAP
jgi:hypothetical protein